jgi:dephospho-CoA kinase
MEKLEDEGETEIFILEAALLIEEHYDQILDELWYIDADKEIRRERLRESRGYSDEKIDGIMKSQLSEEEFYKACDAVISNNRSKEETYQEIDEEIKRIRHHLVV